MEQKKNKKHMLVYTGALTSKPYAFTSRPWELRSVNSIDVLDGIGSNIRIDFKEMEIVRILPSRNPEINESWISDKIRFFYDGLKRQRLHVPYLKEDGQLKKTKWKKVLSKFSSLLKVYSYEYGSSKIGLISGPNIDTETFFIVKEFAANFGFTNLGLENFNFENQDDSGNYRFQNYIKDVEKADFCLLLGTNPRYEASMLNLRLRKLVKKGSLKLASIGGNFDATYPIDFFSLTSKTLVALVEGKHKLCKSLARANTPVIFYGWKIFDRVDSKSLVNLLKELRILFPQVFGKFIAVNALCSNANSVGALELGIPAFKKEKLKEMKLIYGIGLESFSSVIKENKNTSVFVFQSSHGTGTSKKADFLFPSLSFAEKEGIYYNCEGRPQKAQKAFSGPNLSKDDWMIFSVLFGYLQKDSLSSTKEEVRIKMAKYLPSSSYANVWFSKHGLPLSRTFFFGRLRSERILKSGFKLFLEDFFMSSSLCYSSQVMAKASESLRSSTTNYKFLATAS